MATHLWRLAGLLGALALGGCSTLPDTSSYRPPPQGATWTNNVRLTGSYGAGERQVTSTMGTHRWQGRDVTAVKTPTGGVLIEIDGGWIAQLAGDEPVLTWDPPISFNRPLVVGDRYSKKMKATNHRTKRTVEFEGTWTVEAYEVVNVPAGRFLAYRVAYTDTTGTSRLDWLEPGLNIFVKSSVKRMAQNPNGAGTFDSEVVSHTISR